MNKQEFVNLVRENIGMKATLETDHTIHKGTITRVVASTNRILVCDASDGVKGEKSHHIGDDAWILPENGGDMQQGRNKIVVTWHIPGRKTKGRAARITNYTLTIHA